jgi:hypothetical protein
VPGAAGKVVGAAARRGQNPAQICSRDDKSLFVTWRNIDDNCPNYWISIRIGYILGQIKAGDL